jgi:hypothetical protein
MAFIHSIALESMSTAAELLPDRNRNCMSAMLSVTGRWVLLILDDSNGRNWSAADPDHRNAIPVGPPLFSAQRLMAQRGRIGEWGDSIEAVLLTWPEIRPHVGTRRRIGREPAAGCGAVRCGKLDHRHTVVSQRWSL